MRLENNVAIVVGAGQSPGPTMGNGRAAALTFAREGARVLCVDRDIAGAEETVEMIEAAGGTAEAARADITVEDHIVDFVADAVNHWGRIDILHNNVGISVEGGDAPITDITEEAFDRIMNVNLRGMVMTCKHVLPVMREGGSGAIVNISSVAAHMQYPWTAYKLSKQAVIALTEQLAIQNAPHNIRANVILPGLMDTPMAVDRRAVATGKSRSEIAEMRDAQVPLGGKMGTAWDVANAALFLVSEDARFITGAALPVDGGQLCKIG